MLKRVIKNYTESVIVGKVFPRNGVSFIYGNSGIGKTVSTIKALNEDGIVPILLDYDNNLSPKANKCKYIHIDGYAVTSEDDIVTGEVVIIDTYALMNKEIAHKIIKNNNTVIVVGHNKDIATKRDIPDADEVFVNHCDAKLFLSENTKNKTIDLKVIKCRGYTGFKTITNW